MWPYAICLAGFSDPGRRLPNVRPISGRAGASGPTHHTKLTRRLGPLHRLDVPQPSRLSDGNEVRRAGIPAQQDAADRRAVRAVR